MSGNRNRSATGPDGSVGYRSSSAGTRRASQLRTVFRTLNRGCAPNQLRLYLSAVAYELMHALRRLGLRGTAFAKATVGTVRTRLLKIGAQVRVSVRRIQVALASGNPYVKVFFHAWRNLRAGPEAEPAV